MAGGEAERPPVATLQPWPALPPQTSPTARMWTRDNLGVLRGLNSASIDLVYADPPFNSNKNYEAPIGSKAAGET